MRSDDRIQQALALRAAGESWHDIAQRLGYASADAVRITCAKHKPLAAAIATPPVPIQAAWSRDPRRPKFPPMRQFYES